MMTVVRILLCTVISAFCAFSAADAQEILRGEVQLHIIKEPVFGSDQASASGRIKAGTEAQQAAVSEAAAFFAGMIYGWSFHYDIGERARKIEEKFVWESLGSVESGDRSLRTETPVVENKTDVYMWTEYRLSAEQTLRIGHWRTGARRTAQAVGYAFPGERLDAVRDAARAAVRAALRGTERNRPKVVTGYIALAAFPRFYMDKGKWAASCRFSVEILEIVPFSAY